MGTSAHGNHLIKEYHRAQYLDGCSSMSSLNIFLFIQESSLCNFADDNTTSISAENAHELHRLVQLNVNKCVAWFNSNYRTANPSEFQSLSVSKNDSNIKEFEIK